MKIQVNEKKSLDLRHGCSCGHHALAHQVAYREEFGSRAGKFGLRQMCADCRCQRYSANGLTLRETRLCQQG